MIHDVDSEVVPLICKVSKRIQDEHGDIGDLLAGD
jgi:hypothetical protein